jgi:hypothetical protein
MELDWVRNVRKLAVKLENHLGPLMPPAGVLQGYLNWIITVVDTIVARFHLLRRLYLVLDAHDANCTLPFGADPNDEPGQDGFVYYRRFLFEHRNALGGGHICACKMLSHPQPGAVAHGPLYNILQDGRVLQTLNGAVNASHLHNPTLAQFEVYWVVDVKS